jgi:hypothetical protein
MRPVVTGSLAARAVEPGQIRKEAALRRLPRVPRITWWPSVSWTHCHFQTPSPSSHDGIHPLAQPPPLGSSRRRCPHALWRARRWLCHRRKPTYTVYVDGRRSVLAAATNRLRSACAAGITASGRRIVSSRNPPPPRPRRHSGPARPFGYRAYGGRQQDLLEPPAHRLAAFIAEVGLTGRRTDQIAGDGHPISFAALESAPLPDILEIGNFVTVTIEDGERQQTVRTAAQTVGAHCRRRGLRFMPRTASSRRWATWLSPVW